MIPPIIIPEKEGTYKAVQFRIHDLPYLRLGKLPLEEKKYFHEDILESFAQEIGAQVAPRTINNSQVNDFADTPTHRIVGAGYCTLNQKDKTITFFSTSQAYQIGIDMQHLKDILPYSAGYCLTAQTD